jgi:integrase/recombinase XerD
VNPLHFDPERRGMPVMEWPESDRALWRAALVAGDLLEEGGALARYAAETNRKLAKNYARWLTWLSRRGLLDEHTPPAERITPERVKAWVTDLQTINASGTILARLQALYEMAKVLDTGGDWCWIRRIESRVRARHVPARAKRGRLVGAADLLSLGVRLMENAPALSTDRLRAMQFRDGLIIAVLAARPLRLRNLAGLELERTLVPRGDAWWIDIPPEETKTREPIEVPWPEALTAPLATYLDGYRPILCRLRNRWTRPVEHAMWVSTHGSPMCQAAVYETIVGRTGEAFGRPINPHLFRDCAATSIAIDDPKHVRIASQILGHQSTATTERYYNQAQAIEAARRYQDFLVGLRKSTMAEEPESTESR